jgi:hypothetical protein
MSVSGKHVGLKATRNQMRHEGSIECMTASASDRMAEEQAIQSPISVAIHSENPLGLASTSANKDQPPRWTEETRAGDPSLNADFSAFFGDTNADFSAFFGDTNADFPLDFLLPDMPVLDILDTEVPNLEK